MTIFSTTNFIVRQFTIEDADNFYFLNSNPEVLRYIRPIKTKKECNAFLNEQLQEYKSQPSMGRWLVADKSTNHFIGTFSILFMQGDVDYHIGYALMPNHWGKGYATDLLQQGVKYFCKNFTSKQLFAITQKENIASEKVLDKVGFKLCGSITRVDEVLNLFAFESIGNR